MLGLGSGAQVEQDGRTDRSALRRGEREAEAGALGEGRGRFGQTGAGMGWGWGAERLPRRVDAQGRRLGQRTGSQSREGGTGKKWEQYKETSGTKTSSGLQPTLSFLLSQGLRLSVAGDGPGVLGTAGRCRLQLQVRASVSSRL